jgi:hypothetical protein
MPVLLLSYILQPVLGLELGACTLVTQPYFFV